MNRPRYTPDAITRFMALARGGRDRRAAALTAAMDRHPAGKARTVAPSAHAAAGMSTRAIAPVVGVTDRQVRYDAQAGGKSLPTSPALAALDLTNPRTTLALLDDEDKGPRSVRTPGGQGRPHGREDR